MHRCHRIPACLLLGIFALVMPIRAETAQARTRPLGPLETSCVDCHSQLDDEALEPVKRAANDIHFEKGLSCHDCHGGNPEAGFDGDVFAAHDEDAGFTGKPARLEIPLFCARCHTDSSYMKRFNPLDRVDQYTEYRTSTHGRRNAAGDEKVATCVDCHGNHGILAVSDPRSMVYPTNLAETCARCHALNDLMQQYGLRSTPYRKYRSSVHAQALYNGNDLSAPTCNDCHGNHGAVPPGVDSVGNVCASCHGREASLFRDAETKRNLDLKACIRCLVCHESHAIVRPTEEMLGTGPQSTCIGCHIEGEAGYTAAVKMQQLLESLVARLKEARQLLSEAERAGVETGPDQFALHKAQDSLIEARVLVHGFDLERFSKVAMAGIRSADEGIAAGHRAFAELRYRRLGLGLSLIVVLAVILALLMTIRRIEA
ncbi:MAG: hypothetical protein ACE5HU_09835 [Acidobacteriota bacterium]